MPLPSDPSRRRFIQTASVAGLAAALSGCSSAAAARAAAPARPTGSAGRARNVILVVSDGMSAGAITLAERYSQTFHGRSTHWAALMNAPGVHTGLQDTASADSLVTDSAAAASSWGCGHRVNNGAINITPDGVAREPILVKARRAGKATGLVTTAHVTHATPAGFAANVAVRGSEADIAAQYLERGIDVMLGGGRPHFVGEVRPDGRDLIGEFARAGHAIVHNRRDLLGASTENRRLLGLFSDGHVPYVIDRENSPELAASVPSLAEMTRAALARLVREPNGFVLQVEGGRIDHAAHANDAAALVHEQLDLDAALADVIAFQQGHPDTLVIVTTDHGNGNPGLNSEGANPRSMRNLNRVKASFDIMLQGLRAEQSVEAIQARLVATSNLQITADGAALVRAALAGKLTVAYRGLGTVRSVLGQVLANHLAIGWTGRWHTGDWVVLNAFGPGSQAFPNLVHNHAIHGIMLEALGIG